MAKLPEEWVSSLAGVGGQLLVVLVWLLSSCGVKSPLKLLKGFLLYLWCSGGTSRAAVECSSRIGKGVSSLVTMCIGTLSRCDTCEPTLILARPLLFICGLGASSLVVEGGFCVIVMCGNALLKW